MAARKTLPTAPDGLGNDRPLGFLRGKPRRMAAVPTLADSDLIPEADWVEYDEWPEHIKIKDQDGRGACNGFAAALGVETLAWSAGMEYVPLSGWYVYSILCNGVDRGSMILDALGLVTERGVAPESEVPYGLINPRRLTESAHQKAAGYKVELGERLTTYQQIGTAVQRRQSINLAVCVGDGFNDLDGDGRPRLGRGYCNHAVHVGYGMRRAKDGSWVVKMANSWSEAWGLSGFCWLPLKQVPVAAAFEAYTLRAGVDSLADRNNPPILLA
jgi:hypothetical protein